MRGLQQNNPQIIRLAGEMVGLVKTKEGFSLNLQQNNTTTSVSIGEREDRVSLEQIVRQREDERRKRLGLAQPAETFDVVAAE